MALLPEPSRTERRLAKAYEKNSSHYAKEICAGTNGWVIEEDDICVHARPITAFGNGMFYVKWKAEAVTHKLARAIELYKKTGQGLFVIAGPSSPIPQLREALLGYGFRCNYYIPFMHLDLNEIQKNDIQLETITIRQTKDCSIFKESPHPWHGKVTTKPRRALFDFLERKLNAPNPTLWQFIAFEGTLPVASVIVYRSGKIAGIYEVATIESHRRRGIATQLLSEACHFARDQGMTAAALGASGVGIELYEKIGFKHCGKYGSYFMGKARVATL